jgi:hypothetical protein
VESAQNVGLTGMPVRFQKSTGDFILRRTDLVGWSGLSSLTSMTESGNGLAQTVTLGSRVLEN